MFLSKNLGDDNTPFDLRESLVVGNSEVLSNKTKNPFVE